MRTVIFKLVFSPNPLTSLFFLFKGKPVLVFGHNTKNFCWWNDIKFYSGL